MASRSALVPVALLAASMGCAGASKWPVEDLARRLHAQHRVDMERIAFMFDDDPELWSLSLDSGLPDRVVATRGTDRRQQDLRDPELAALLTRARAVHIFRSLQGNVLFVGEVASLPGGQRVDVALVWRGVNAPPGRPCGLLADTRNSPVGRCHMALGGRWSIGYEWMTVPDPLNP